MNRSLTLSLTLAGAMALAGCNEALDPNVSLTADIQAVPGHIHALETNVTYTVQVTYPVGTGNVRALATDFETLAIEQNLAGTTAWRRLNLVPSGNGGAYIGTHLFINPGSYTVRLVGKRAGQSGEMVIKQLATPMAAVRSHFDAGGYRVEFDITPGFPNDLTTNKAYTVQFYVMQSTADVNGNRAPIAGLTGVMIRCTDANGAIEDHAASEASPGVYQATHVFLAKGMVNARLTFPGTSGSAVVDMPLGLQ